MSFRYHLLDFIDRTGVSDRMAVWLVAASLCVLLGDAPVQGSGAADREALAALPNLLPTASPRPSSSSTGAPSDLFVPVILTASGASNSYYTSELTLTNRGSQPATLRYTYTAHAGGGRGTASETLATGRQKILPNAIDYLRSLGIPIPASGNRIGTLRVGVSGSSELSVTVRTTTQVADGRAGLAYPGVAVADGFTEAVYLCGLRQDRQDRSNVAFQNMGVGNITVRATVFSGDSGDSRVFPDVVLAPGGFRQLNGILATAGYTQGYVRVERVSGAAPFYAYGVINDQANSDGSFVFPVTESALAGVGGQTLPVIIEHPNFSSELIVTNFSDEAKAVDFGFVADGIATEDGTARFYLTLAAGEQRIIPGIVEEMRRQGVAGLGRAGRTLVGAVFATGRSGDLSGVVIGARTGSPGGGGQYSVFYNAVPYGAAFDQDAWIDALQQNRENRSNLALVNTGQVDGGDSVFQLDIYDGAAGQLVNTVTGLRVAARGWRQINGILDKYAPGATQGYVRIRKSSGNNPFLAYGVINDGGAPGQRSGDGAYLPASSARARIHDPGGERMTDREVLEALYHATGGPAWNDRTNWLSAAPLGEWFGVDTDGTGRVTRLNLSRNGLSGSIPPELGNLASLQWLSLGGNQLSGVIPAELGNLASLQSLSLGGNQLSGVIPAELGSLTSLQWLSLSGNQLSGSIPPELGNLASLQSLSLGGNQLSGVIPAELGSLTSLQWLSLSGNQLSGSIPPELGNLASLQSLSLGGNQLSGVIPAELGSLTSLQWLSLSGNRLSGVIPAELGSLTSLQRLDLGGRWDSTLQKWIYNQLSGAIPKSLQKLSELTSLNIWGTAVCVPADSTFQAWLDTLSEFRTSGLVCDGTRRVLFSASNYSVREGESTTVSVRLIDQAEDPRQSLVISLTAMGGGGATVADYTGVPESVNITLPATEAEFVFTAVADDHFDGFETVVLGFRRPLPSVVTAGNPDTATVTIIDPGTDGVTREVLEALYHATGGPKWRDRTSWLSDLPLSEWFGVGTDGAGRVTSLDLSGNQLSGSIPLELGSLASLQSLDLSGNRLSGVIPAELGNLASLQRLDLGGRWDSTLQKWIYNQLSGVIPAELGSLTSLQWLSLSGNQLSGSIPLELGSLANLQSLSLSDNQLSGSIPPELGNLANLQSLSLGGNQLSGSIPPELGNLANLQSLDLGGRWDSTSQKWIYNQLSGVIPAELGSLTSLQWLSLSGNQLSGSIPPELGNLASLQSLSLGGNQLSGVIPAELGNLASLQSLSLGGNQLSGVIPAELGSLANLQSLSLGGNQLSGSIPPELGNLASLQWLSLGGNQLSGVIPAELGNLASLQSLSLGGNQLSGAIPAELGSLANLQSLSLGGNQLSGVIPAELGSLTSLQWLSLSGNQLSGVIPAELGSLTSLQRLDLGGRWDSTLQKWIYNQLSGAIPKSLQKLSELTSLNIWGTAVCVPADSTFQAWLDTLSEFRTSGLVCDGTRRVLFSASNYSVREGESTTVSVRLIDQAEDPRQSLVISLTAMGGGGATVADYTGVPESVNITLPATEAEFVFTAVADDHFDGFETVVLGFRRPLPSVVTAGNPDTATVTIIDPGTDGVTREVLEALYHATGGPKWRDRTSWLSDLPLSEWFGVGTDGAGRVTSLDLSGNQLSGSIPLELGSLASLQSLDLSGNQLSGSIPPELGNLANLQSLDLGGRWDSTSQKWIYNQLSGSIPAELGSLTSLQWLSLSGNQLSGSIPPELGSLASLQSLDLSGNQLSGSIPPELGNLANLQSLDLGGRWDSTSQKWIYNQLSGSIPAELGSLTSLQWLSLSGNQLSGSIPPELGSLASLQSLSLGGNQLSGVIPAELGNLASLQSLSLGGNQLSGVIPAELGSLANLQSLSLGGNQLSGSIPPELGNLANLQSLDLGGRWDSTSQKWIYNQLSGVIPAELGSLTSLQWLSLSGNQLSGSIPPELGNLANLQSLSLGGNQLSGVIPAELGNLASLQSLSLGGNQLSGVIPAELGSLANLQSLSLGGNQLSGVIPAELGSLANLQSLFLGGNQLSGPIPQSFLQLDRLQNFYISWRNETLCIPGISAFVAWLEGIESRDESGTFCNESDWKVLESLFERAGGSGWTYADGWVSGPALGEWHGVRTDSLGRVTALDLERNRLSGRLPATLGALAQMTELRISDNADLSGHLPISLAGLSLRALHYDGTGLCASTAASFQQWLSAITSHEGTGTECLPLSDREALEAAYDSLRGPDWTNSDNWLTDRPLRNWYGVEVDGQGRVISLSLTDNRISGWIPPELGSLEHLELLQLGGFDLTGTIPPELGDLANLRNLGLFDTHLEGTIPPELGNLANLEWLTLAGNNLEGAIPAELGRLRNLRALDLAANRLSGTVPAELGNLADLRWMSLSSNELTGPIPAQFDNLSHLQGLSLDRNGLVGPLPAVLGGLAGLEELHVGFNNLHGTVPSEFQGLASLRELSLPDNADMSGPLPAELTALDSLETLIADGTGLCAPSATWLDALLNGRIPLCGSSPAMSYLVQTVQSREFPVPLVAGEEALLRTFVTATRANREPLPPVRASFHVGAARVHVAEIPASAGPIPTEVEQGSLAASANAVIPAEVIRPGLEMVIEIDPDGTLDPRLGVARRIPETGRLPVDVREMPVLDLTVIPFLWSANPDSEILDHTAGMAADPQGHELLSETRTLLPVGSLDVTAHAPVHSSSNSMFALIRESGAIRALEGGSGHWMGMMSGPITRAGGVAQLGGRVSSSAPNPSTIAHELGHNMNLRHAPCGRAGGPDPAFPYRDGSSGAGGYDFDRGRLVRPSTPDLMSYCGPHWVSDYHFSKALRFRIEDEGGGAAAMAAEAVPSLLLWGGVDADGSPFLEPAFAVDTLPLLPDSAGDYRINGNAAGGETLFSISFTMPVLADGDGRSSFAFALPADPAWAGQLASLTLIGPNGGAKLDAETERPMAILRDQQSGQVRGILRDPPSPIHAGRDPEARAAELGLEVLFSRGIPDAAAWRR